MFRVLQLSVLVVACIAAPASAEGDATVLLPRLAPGFEARYGFQEVVTVTSEPVAAGGGPMTHTYITESKVRVRALEASAEGFKVEVMHERMRFDAISRLLKNPPSFDTAAPVAEAVENPFAPALLAVINKPIIVMLSASGRITSVIPPKVDVPDVDFAVVARQFLTPSWITLRLQPIFSLGERGSDDPEGHWTSVVEVPMATSSRRMIRVRTDARLKTRDDDTASVTMTSDAVLLPNPEGVQDTNAILKEFKGVGAAAWNISDGILQSFSSDWVWSLDTLPQEDLPTRVESSIKTLLVRLRQ